MAQAAFLDPISVLAEALDIITRGPFSNRGCVTELQAGSWVTERSSLLPPFLALLSFQQIIFSMGLNFTPCFFGGSSSLSADLLCSGAALSVFCTRVSRVSQ